MTTSQGLLRASERYHSAWHFPASKSAGNTAMEPASIPLKTPPVQKPAFYAGGVEQRAARGVRLFLKFHSLFYFLRTYIFLEWNT